MHTLSQHHYHALQHSIVQLNTDARVTFRGISCKSSQSINTTVTLVHAKHKKITTFNSNNGLRNNRALQQFTLVHCYLGIEL